jgi:hypothetical protein
MAQTAVEFFIKELRQLALKESHHLGMGDIRMTQGMIDDFEEKYKQIGKQQIIDSHHHGFTEGVCFGATTVYKYMTAEQYYNETFNKTQAQ